MGEGDKKRLKVRRQRSGCAPKVSGPMPSRDILVRDYRGRIDRYVYVARVMRNAPGTLVQLSIAATIMNRSTDRLHQLIREGRLYAVDLLGENNPRHIHVCLEECLSLGRLDDTGRRMGATERVMEARRSALIGKNRTANEKVKKKLQDRDKQLQAKKSRGLRSDPNASSG